MKLLLFGATGGTGQQILTQALARDHVVTVVVRTPAAVALASPRLIIVQGDVLQPTTFAHALAGQDVVISALGVRTGRAPTTLYSTSATHILAAMACNGVRRIIAVTAGAYVRDPADGVLIRWVVKPLLVRILANIYRDMQRMEGLVQASDSDWTIIRPARLIDGPPTGHYRAIVERVVPNGWQIRRADVADYILNHLDQPATFRKAISLAE